MPHGRETHCLHQQLVVPATSCIPVETGGSVTPTPYVHPFIFLMKFKSAMKFSPGVCEHVASDLSNSVNYPLLYFIPFRSYCFSCFNQKLLFHVSFKSYILFHSFGELAYFTLFRFAEKVNNANKKMIIQNKTAMFLGHFAKN